MTKYSPPEELAEVGETARAAADADQREDPLKVPLAAKKKNTVDPQSGELAT